MPVWTAAQTTLSTGVIVALVVLALVELALIVVALVDLARRPAVLGGRKWVWVLVIVVFNLIGPIVYLAVGREPAPVADDEGAPREGTGDRVAATADLLYGPASQPHVGDGQGPPPQSPA